MPTVEEIVKVVSELSEEEKERIVKEMLAKPRKGLRAHVRRGDHVDLFGSQLRVIIVGENRVTLGSEEVWADDCLAREAAKAKREAAKADQEAAE